MTVSNNTDGTNAYSIPLLSSMAVFGYFGTAHFGNSHVFMFILEKTFI